MFLHSAILSNKFAAHIAFESSYLIINLFLRSNSHSIKIVNNTIISINIHSKIKYSVLPVSFCCGWFESHFIFGLATLNFDPLSILTHSPINTLQKTSKLGWAFINNLSKFWCHASSLQVEVSSFFIILFQILTTL